MKRTFALFLAVLLVLSLAIFVQAGEKKDWEIVVVPKDASNPWFVRMKVGVDEYAKETGINAYQKGTAEIDATLQAQLVQDLIAQGVDALCVIPMDPEQLDPVLQKAMDAGIVVVTHEASNQQSMHFDIEAFDNRAYGAGLMDQLAALMGEEGEYAVFVGSLGSKTHNEWVDGAIERQLEAYPNMTMVGDKNESFDDTQIAYEKTKELLRAYPDIKGFQGTSSYDAPGVARAIEELGLVGKVFTSGTGMPAANKALLETGSVKSLTLWDPALAGKAMIALAVKVLNGDKIEAPVDLAVDGYTALTFKTDSDKVLEGQGWIVINKDNVDGFGF